MAENEPTKGGQFSRSMQSDQQKLFSAVIFLNIESNQYAFIN